ncbi:MAG TPA: LuxR C-terminal-related transcriptional regulator [Polyangiaceae bacterium]
MAFRYDATEGWVDAGIPALHLFPQQFAMDFFDQKDAPPEVARELARVFLTIRFGSLRDVIQYAGFVPLGAVLDRYGVEDMVGVNGLDPSGRGCMLAIATPRRKHSPRTQHLWHRLAAHISAGNRLRAVLEKLASETQDLTAHAEAILSPSGKIEHATGPAEPRAARDALRDALVRIDAARGERDDPERSVELWRGLVAGRWSLVEHFERDGRRYYLAHKNAPELARDRTLTPQEQLVLGYAELGHSNKLISYELGLAASTIDHS